MRQVLVICAILAFGCESPDPGPASGIDAGFGNDAAARDAASPAPDAGSSPSTCPSDLPAPEPFDCTTVDPPPIGDAISAEPRTWTWVGFDEAVCMDGSSTGIGVSINPDSSNLLILLEGGGACFDSISCAGVTNADGYGVDKFNRDRQRLLLRGLLDREDLENPLRDWSFVYVPYCTGDVHGGQSAEGVGGRYHFGRQNFAWFLTRIVPTFPDVEQVLLAGRSAGGLGTLINYPQAAEAFGCVPVHVLNDGGGILPDAYMRPCLQTRVRQVWSLDGAIPSECGDCRCSDGGGFANVLPFAAARYPDRRFAFLSSLEDTTMRNFYGFGYSPGCNLPQGMPAEDYTAGLHAVRELVSGYDNFHTWYTTGSQHTFTYQGLGVNSTGGVSVAEWLRRMIDAEPDGPPWTDVGP